MLNKRDLARFWSWIDRREDDECWPWEGVPSSTGYGLFSYGGRKGKRVGAHRIAWMLTNGSLPEIGGHHGAVVMHACDNRLCCNPRHLRVASQGDNIKDAEAKDRSDPWGHKKHPRLGERHLNSKLSDNIVRQIRASKKSGAEIARQLGLNRSTVNRVRRRQTWAHI